MSRTTDRRLIAVKPVAVPLTDPTTRFNIDLLVKVTAPTDGQDLPVVVFSHGNAWSMDGYQPLVDRWAAAGFVVIQPTHLDWRGNGIGFTDPRFASIWRVRIDDLHAVLDHLPEVLGQVEGSAGRVDLDRVAVVGHSWGGQSAGALLGARVLPPVGDPDEDFRHPLVRAGALLATTGTGETLTPFASEHLAFMRPDYSTMTIPALVITGGKDQSAMSTRGPDWFTDAFHLSPAPKRMLTITDGEHTLGGIAGEAVRETSDEDPARVALVADAVSAYLLDTLTDDPARWQELQEQASASSGVSTIDRK